MLISRSISKFWEENSFTLHYIPAYHIAKQLEKSFFEIKMYCKQQTIWTNIIWFPCLDNWDHFDRVAVNLSLTNSSSLLHTYFSQGWNPDCENWYKIYNWKNYSLRLKCKQQTIWTYIIWFSCLDNWDHFDRVAVNLPLTNSSSLLHTYLSQGWNPDCENWYKIWFKIYLSSSCIGAFNLEHISGLSAKSWIQKSWWWHFSNLL